MNMNMNMNMNNAKIFFLNFQTKNKTGNKEKSKINFVILRLILQVGLRPKFFKI